MFGVSLLFTTALIKFEIIEDKCNIRRPKVPPRPPINLTVHAQFFDALLVYWQEPAPGTKPIEHYVIGIRSNFSRWRKVKRLPVSCRGATVTELQQGVTYQLRVRAVSEHGVGDPSPPLEISTAGRLGWGWSQVLEKQTWIPCKGDQVQSKFCYLMKLADVPVAGSYRYKPKYKNIPIQINDAIVKLLSEGKINKQTAKALQAGLFKKP